MPAQLTIQRTDSATMGLHGAFQNSNATLKLAVRGRTAGFIIQHVVRRFEVYRLANGTAGPHGMTANEMEDFITPRRQGSRKVYADVLEYWEAWALPNGDEDVVDSFNFFGFSTTADLKYYEIGTKGAFEQTGTANFYADTNPRRTIATLGFVSGVRTNLANGLPYTETRPQPTPTPSNRVTRTTAVTWDDRTTSRTQSGQTRHDYKTVKVTDTP